MLASLRLFLATTMLVGFSFDSADAQHSLKHLDTLLLLNAPDTLDAQVGPFGEASEMFSRIDPQHLTNELFPVHHYLGFYDNQIVRNDLGNVGSAEHLLLFDRNRSFGFQFRQGRYSFWIPLKDRMLYSSSKMFSRVTYTNGANRENVLKAEFVRGFGKSVDVGFTFDRVNSLGLYDRQRNGVTDFSVFTDFRSSDERYRADLMFTYTNINAEENGGLQNDSIFENNVTPGRTFIPVSLQSSSNLWKGLQLGLDHEFLLSKVDSSSTGRKMRPRIWHRFDFTRSDMIYTAGEDALDHYSWSGDSLGTYDSTRLMNVKNILGFELARPDSITTILDHVAVGLYHEYQRVSYDSSGVNDFHNVGVIGGAAGSLSDRFSWDADGKLMFFGYNQWDVQTSGQLKLQVGGSQITADIRYHLYTPDHLFANYSSNHFSWDNDLRQTQHLRAALRFDQKRLRLNVSLGYHLLEGMMLFGPDRLPFQSNTVNQLAVVRAKEHFKVRWFHLVLDGAVQWNISGDELRVPTFLGRGSLYYQNDLFKKRLRLQVGVEANYWTAYYANAYNPALSAFHLQNDKKVGNYPFMDVFLNIRIKKLRAFFKLMHLNAGWSEYRYYHVPHYPVNDLAWKFGVSWAFFD